MCVLVYSGTVCGVEKTPEVCYQLKNETPQTLPNPIALNCISQAAMASDHGLPPKHRALVLTSTKSPPSVKTLPTPQPTQGSAVIRVLAAGVMPHMRGIYDGTAMYGSGPFIFPTPLVTGNSAVGRVVALGPDSTKLTPGQLVLVDPTIRSRDNPTGDVILAGLHEGFTDGSRKLMRGEWRDSTFAEYAKVPLENCHILNEKRLVGSTKEGGLEFQLESLLYLLTLLIPYAGLRDINLQAGETVIVSPATGSISGAAVRVALAMGARVIAMGRNVEALQRIAAISERVEVVPITSDAKADLEALQRLGPIDAFFELHPPAASRTNNIKTAIQALRPGGRVSLMGGIAEDVPLPITTILLNNLTLKGKFMYDREDVAALFKLVETGLLKLDESTGVKVVGKFGLGDWDEAFTTAAKKGSDGLTVLAP